MLQRAVRLDPASANLAQLADWLPTCTSPREPLLRLVAADHLPHYSRELDRAQTASISTRSTFRDAVSEPLDALRVVLPWIAPST